MRRRKYDITEILLKEALNTITPELRCETLGLIDYLRINHGSQNVLRVLTWIGGY